MGTGASWRTRAWRQTPPRRRTGSSSVFDVFRQQAPLAQQRLDRRHAPAERGVGLLRRHAVARAVDALAQARGGLGVERAAGFLEGVERVGVEHLSPEVDVIPRGV